MAAGFVDDPREQDYIAAARVALRQRNVRLALQQIAAALSFSPSSTENLRLLSDILAQEARPLRHLEAKDETFFGTMAIRARVLATEQRLGEAIALLCETVAFRPLVPYLAWLKPWASGRRSLRGVRADAVLGSIAKLSNASDIHPVNVECAVWLLERLASERPAASTRATALASRLLRAQGAFRRAEELLFAAGVDGEALEVRVERAMMFRETNRLAEAIALLTAVVERTPTDLPAQVDRLQLLCESERIDEVLAVTSTLKDVNDSTAWLVLGSCRNFALARKRPLQPSPQLEVKRLADRLSIYRDRVPVLGGDVADAVRDTLFRAARERPTEAVRLNVLADTAIPRSAQLALEAGLRELGTTGSINGATAPPPTPLPSDAAVRSIEALVSSPFDLTVWLTPADRISRDDVLRLLVHPPAPRCGLNPVDRLHVVQLATLAMGTRDLPPARQLEWLESFAIADDSWLAAAALPLLGTLALVDPTNFAQKVTAIFQQVAEALALLRSDARRGPLAFAWLRAGLLDNDDARALVARIEFWREPGHYALFCSR